MKTVKSGSRHPAWRPWPPLGAQPPVASIAAPGGLAQVQLAALGAPQPQDPPPRPQRRGKTCRPRDQLSSLCTQATDPGVSYTTKTNLVENGISPDEGHAADHDLRKAYRNGEFSPSSSKSTKYPAGRSKYGPGRRSHHGPEIRRPGHEAPHVHQPRWQLDTYSTTLPWL